jgi:hypothetical protein
LDPSPRNPIEEDCRLASLVEHLDPVAPKFGETFGQQDVVESIPANGFECLAEVKLEDCSRCVAFVTALKNVGSIHKVFSDTPP